MSTQAKDRRADIASEQHLVDIKKLVCTLLEPLDPDSRKRVLAAVACLSLDDVADHVLGYLASGRRR